MCEKDDNFLERDLTAHPWKAPRPPAELIEDIPNIDHRFGDGRAEVLGIAVYSNSGEKLSSLRASSPIVVRISARAKANLEHPIIGFIFRNHLAVRFAGTNTPLAGHRLPPQAERED